MVTRTLKRIFKRRGIISLALYIALISSVCISCSGSYLSEDNAKNTSKESGMAENTTSSNAVISKAPGDDCT